MASVVASKPSDGPTSPGLMSYGSDPAALDDYLNLDLFGTRAAHSPGSSHGALPVTPNTNEPTMDEPMAYDGFNPLDKNIGAFDMGLLGMDQYSTLFQDMFPTFSEAPGPSAPVIDPQLFTAPEPVPPPPAPIESEEDADDDEELDEVAPLPATRSRRPKKNAAAAGGIAKRPSRASTPASVVPAYVHFEDPKPVIPPALGKGGRAIQEGRLSAEATGLPPPRPLTPEQTASPATPTTTARRPTDLARANTQKDRSSDATGRSFWGGAVGGHGGVTSVHTTLIPEVFPTQLSGKPRHESPSSSSSSSASPSTPPNEGVNMNPLMNLSPLFGSAKLPASPAVNVGLDVMDQAFNQRTLEGFRAQLWGRMAKEAGARSVLERRAEADASPAIASPAQQTSAQQSPLFSSPCDPSSPQSQTISSSPSLSMLNQPATLRSLFESASSRFESQSTPAQSTPLFQSSTPTPLMQSSPTSLFQSSTPTPALLQASSFGAGFLGSTQPSYAQSAASMQARAMLQAQWLALQQARQQNASTQPGSSSAQPVSSAQPSNAQFSGAQSSNAQSTQRELYLAHFAQAAAAQQAQQQVQQQQLSGLAAGVRPAYFASSKDKERDLVSAMSGLSIDKKSSEKKSEKKGSEKAFTFTEKKFAPIEKQGTTDKFTPERKGTTPQQAALVASIASQTLLQRMGSAFWDAFSTGSRDVDTNKVRRVLEGKAVVRVVDVDPDMGEGKGVFGNLRGKK
ncbi:unnamed protein product [Rhizoctonia solani]|uniref:Uncharacterized protein n=1 Tax=Rhizoctonia solani TaxID=456999 RepID=A0A8H3DBL3_9AGAM|nr:unnamed protein product [Rhizoctonia solani]